jgi:predicted Fe-Mo cluster-binding NifX family protein
MRIAVASQNWRTVTAHPGKTRRFLVFETMPGADPREVDRIDLPREMTLHNRPGVPDHPLFHVDAVISGSAGDGFVRRLGDHGVRVATTSERDPLTAIRLFLADALPAAPPHLHDTPHP